MSEIAKSISNIFCVCFFPISVPVVSTDGDSHEILTLVACVSGLVVACVVIVIIVMVMRCGKVEQQQGQAAAEKINETDSAADNSKPRMGKGRLSIFTIFGHSRRSFDVEHNV